MKKSRKSQGFTLIELLVAIVILGIITVMAIPQISNLVSSNESAKYETYQETIETSAKLYTDSYKEDMFGYNQSGCYDIKFEELQNKKLVQDININNVTCSGGASKQTFVRVYKSGDLYKYKVSIICTDKNNTSEIHYKDLIDTDIEHDTTFCDGQTQDTTPPKIDLSVNGSTWSTGVGLKTKIIISDEFGLLENTEIKYAWTTTPSAVPSSAWKSKRFSNTRGTEKVTLELDVPQGKDEDYYLVIYPSVVVDANMNVQTAEFKSNAFQFDNTAPSCTITIEGTEGWDKWYTTKPTVKMTYKDERGQISTYGMSTTNQTDNSKLDFNEDKEKTQGDTKGITWYGYIKDGAGNIARCNSGSFKVDSTPPSPPDKGKISISGSSTSATLATVSGASDATSGVKEYYYIVKNNSSKPGKTNKAFTTSKNFSRSCGTSYYGFAIAIDNAGNRSSVYSMGSASDGADSYSDWSTCSKTCGSGTRTRTNTCALVTTGLSETCNAQGCCDDVKYGSWSSWGNCSAECGGGKQTRTRKKTSSYDGSNCGTETEERDCNQQDCCSKTTASPGSYGTCSKTCGTGTKTRTVKYYSDYNGQLCSTDTESTSCNTHSCCDLTYLGSSSDWGNCSASCDGGYKYKYNYYYSSYDDSYCGYEEESTTCNTHGCCDWVYADYGSWGECTAECDGGYQYLDIYYYSNYDDSYCGYDYDYSECNTHSCYSCDIQYYTSAGTYCWNAAINMIGSGASYPQLELCTGYDTGCVSANDSRCNLMGGTYLYFKYCP